MFREYGIKGRTAEQMEIFTLCLTAVIAKCSSSPLIDIKQFYKKPKILRLGNFILW